MYVYQVIKIDYADDRNRKIIKTFNSKEEAIDYIENNLWAEREHEFENKINGTIWSWYDEYDGSTYYIKYFRKKRPITRAFSFFFAFRTASIMEVNR